MKIANKTWAAIAFALSCASQDISAQIWSVSLAGQNNEYIDVKLIPTGLPTQGSNFRVEFSVSFYDLNGNTLGYRRYSYLDDQLPTLNSNLIYDRLFVHGFENVISVSGTDMSYIAQANGGQGLRMLNAAQSTDVGSPTAVIARPSGYIVEQSNGFCRKYASDARAQYQANRARKCGYSGSRWSDVFDYHYNWCVTVSSQNASGETQIRGQMLDHCRH